MQSFLIVLASVIVGVALRSCRALFLRKLGALTFLVASFLTFFYFFASLYAGFFGVILWFLLPWIDLLIRIRKLRFPIDNRLKNIPSPSEDHFPNARRLFSEIEDSHFEFVSSSCWQWGGMNQHFQFFWHPEAKTIAALCLCEQDHVAFAFVTLSSKSKNHLKVHTTNYPFSPTLRDSPRSHWLFLPCEKNRFELILREHRRNLSNHRLNLENLVTPQPDTILEEFENELIAQVQYNVDRKLIIRTEEESYRYSTKGLFFLWFQSMKDMIRLC